MTEFTEVYGTSVVKNLLVQERKQAEYLKDTSWIAKDAWGTLGGRREDVMNYLFDLCYQLDFEPQTAQCAAALLDAFLNRRPVRDVSVVKLVGMVCIMIASKQIELKGLIPDELSAISKSRYRSSDICTLEQFVITALDWNLNLLTAAEVIPSILSNLSSLDTDRIAKLANNYAALCYTDAAMAAFGPIAIAIGSVCSALTQLNYLEYADDWTAFLRNSLRIDTSAGTALVPEIKKKLAEAIKGCGLARSSSLSSCEGDL